MKGSLAKMLDERSTVGSTCLSVLLVLNEFMNMAKKIDLMTLSCFNIK